MPVYFLSICRADESQFAGCQTLPFLSEIRPLVFAGLSTLLHTRRTISETIHVMRLKIYQVPAAGFLPFAFSKIFAVFFISYPALNHAFVTCFQECRKTLMRK